MAVESNGAEPWVHAPASPAKCARWEQVPARGPLWLLPPGPDQVRGVASPEPIERARNNKYSGADGRCRHGCITAAAATRFPRVAASQVAQTSVPPGAGGGRAGWQAYVRKWSTVGDRTSVTRGHRSSVSHHTDIHGPAKSVCQNHLAPTAISAFPACQHTDFRRAPTAVCWPERPGAASGYGCTRLGDANQRRLNPVRPLDTKSALPADATSRARRSGRRQ